MATKSIYDLDKLREYIRDDWTKECAERLDNKMRALRMDHRQLAGLVGVPWQTIRRAQLGEILPRDYLRVAIAAGLGCSVSEIWPEPTRHAAKKAAA